MPLTVIETIISELRVQTPVNYELPRISKHELSGGQEVLLYREKSVLYKYTGTYDVFRIQGKQLFINRDWSEVQKSRAQVKPYFEDLSGELTRTHVTEVLHPKDPTWYYPSFMETKDKE